MAESGTLRLRAFDAAHLAAVHQLPCAIETTGPAPVAAYFCPRASADGAGLEATFRGRLLRGVELPLPEGYDGVVLARDKADGWRAERGFKTLTVWGHDTLPGSADGLPRVMQWLRVAQAVAAPVSAAEVDAALAASGPDPKA